MCVEQMTGLPARDDKDRRAALVRASDLFAPARSRAPIFAGETDWNELIDNLCRGEVRTVTYRQRRKYQVL